MALPSTAITRLDLSATFTEFDLAMSRKKFVAPQVFRPVPVGAQSADVGKIPLEALLETQPDDRAPGGEYKRGDFEISSYSYSCQEKAREEPLDDRTLKVYRDVFDAEDIHAQRAVDMLLRNYEIACAAALYDTAVWTGASLATAVSNKWSVAASGTPIEDIEGAKRYVEDNSGLEPNAVVMNHRQLWYAMRTANVVDLLKYSGSDDPKNLNHAVASQLFGLEYIIVAGGIKNTAKKGQSAAISRIWSDSYVMVCRVAETNDPKEPCIGRTFMWSEENAGLGSDEELAIITEEYREEKVRGSVLRARYDRDIKVMYAEAGHLLTTIL